MSAFFPGSNLAAGACAKAIAVTMLVAAATAAQGQSGRAAVNREAESARNDPLIAAIDKIKHSVAPVACLEVNGSKTRIVEIHGSAFFISRRGEFLTAGHVIDLLEGAHPCSVPAIFLPAVRWQSELPEEDFVWFPFKIADCAMKRDIDVAKCTPLIDLSASIPGFSFNVDPVEIETSKQPDGTQVAFTGFPLRSRDPLTSRAGIATYRTESRGAAITSELILDHGAWTGGSGSPVYLSNGRVVGMVLERGTAQSAGIAGVLPIASLAGMFATH